ncbi:unnamed protein product, partial [Mesorhabditis spiculigera]
MAEAAKEQIFHEPDEKVTISGALDLGSLDEIDELEFEEELMDTDTDSEPDIDGLEEDMLGDHPARKSGWQVRNCRMHFCVGCSRVHCRECTNLYHKPLGHLTFLVLLDQKYISYLKKVVDERLAAEAERPGPSRAIATTRVLPPDGSPSWMFDKFRPWK